MTTTITGARMIGTIEPVDLEFTDVTTAIRPAGRETPIGEVIDGAGRFVAPGLIDTHVHLASVSALRNAARDGVTTVVDLGTHPDSLITALRAEVGIPSIISAGSAASAPGSTQIAVMGFPVESGVADPRDAERYLDWRVANGSDLIKIIIEDPAATQVPALDVATITALVDGARRRGLITVAHVVTAAAFDRGLDGGVDILTHAPLDRPLDHATAERMAASGTICSPTLIMMRTMARARLGNRAELAYASSVESVRRMHEAGVMIIAGTDANESTIAPVPHGASMHDELELLQQADLSTEEVLSAATTRATTAVRLPDRGRLEIGARADVILLDGDPTVDLAALRHPTQVWIGGVPVD